MGGRDGGSATGQYIGRKAGRPYGRTSDQLGLRRGGGRCLGVDRDDRAGGVEPGQHERRRVGRMVDCHGLVARLPRRLIVYPFVVDFKKKRDTHSS